MSLDNSFRCKKKKRRNRAIILPTFDCYDIRGREQGAMPIQLTVVGILVGDSLLLRERVEQNNPFPYSRDSFLQKPTTDGCGMMDSKAYWYRKSNETGKERLQSLMSLQFIEALAKVYSRMMHR